MTTPAEEFAHKLRYFSDRLRKGEKLDTCDAAVIAAAADHIVERELVITTADDRMNTAAQILGRGR